VDAEMHLSIEKDSFKQLSSSIFLLTFTGNTLKYITVEKSANTESVSMLTEAS